MEEINTFGDIRDKEVIDRFNEVYNQSFATETAKQVLDRIAGENGWNGQSDEVILASTSVNEYYDLFKSEEGRHLKFFVTTCLKFGQLFNASEQQKRLLIELQKRYKRSHQRVR